MKRSVDEFRRTAKDVESRLDMLQWKMETLAQNGFKTDNPDATSQQDPVTVSKLLKEFSKVKNDFSGVKQELKEELEKMSNESTQLQDRLESMKERFAQLKENVGEPPE